MGKQLAKIIDATPAELREIHALTPERESAVYGAYVDVLAAYLAGDVGALGKILAAATRDFAGEQWFVDLVRLRLQIRTHAVDRKLTERMAEVGATHGHWNGEIWFVVAMAFEQLDQTAQARKYYELAADALTSLGAVKKAVKARLNAVVAESHLHPEKKLLAEYYFIYKEAKSLGQAGVAGIAYLNISREYQRMGAPLVALKYCNRALSLQQHEAGTVSYFLTLVHRAHLNLQLGRTAEAQLDYEQAESSPFPEVRHALEVVDEFRQQLEDAETEMRQGRAHGKKRRAG